MMTTTRLAIVGAGTAGLAALKEAQRYTSDVLLLDPGPYATTCARTGCMPSKALLEVAKGYAARTWLAGAGVEGTERLRANLPQVLAHVRALRDRFVQGPVAAAEEPGERSIRGRVRLLAADTLDVSGQRIHAERIILATGSSPVIPEPMRQFGDYLLTTDTLFEQPDLPAELVVVGLGPVGAELGQALAQLGVRVTACNRSRHVGGLSDPAVNDAAVAELERSMTLRLGAEARLEAADSGVRVIAGDSSLTVAKVLLALGRRPNVADLGLENLGVPLDAQGLPDVDPRTLQIADLPVYLTGDANGDRPLLHEAADEGRLAAYHALNADSGCRARRTPLAIVFTSPNLARVGHGWSELPEDGVIVGAADFTDQARALMAGTNAGRLHVYAAADSGRLLGAELATPAGEHLAHMLAGWIQDGKTLEQALQLPFYHPVIEEGLRSALQHARRQLGERRTQPNLPLCHEPVDWALA